MMHRHMGDHIIAHALAEIGIHEPHDRHIRQARMLHQRVDAGPQRQHSLEPRQSIERLGLGLPHEDVAHIRRIEHIPTPHHRIGRQRHPQLLRPTGFIDIGQVQQQHDRILAKARSRNPFGRGSYERTVSR
jgi:hypothetical protein